MKRQWRVGRIVFALLLLGTTGIAAGLHAESQEAQSDHTLSDDEIKQLRVEWKEPTRWVSGGLGYPRLNDYPATVTIAGKLSLLQPDGKTLKPVDWPLAIAVVLAKKPNDKQDWSQQRDAEIVLEQDIFVNDPYEGLVPYGSGIIWESGRKWKTTGEFKMSFPLEQIKTTPGKTELFQVGISLASRKFLVWTKKQPILPQTVQMVKIQGPQPISKTLQYINACPNVFARKYRYLPLPVIRAANHLRTLGKQEALVALREFASLSHDNTDKLVSIPENLDTSSRQSLDVLIPVLFPNIYLFPNIRNEKDRQMIMVWEGIPFRVDLFWGEITSKYDPSDLIKRAETKGKLLEGPLHPSDNPLNAADTLTKKLYAGKVQGRLGQYGSELRYQALSMVHQLLRVDLQTVFDLRNDEEWDKLKKEAERLKIHWDEEKQEYVAGEKAK